MAKLICNRCGFPGEPKKVKRGSATLERICWMIFPLGLPYTIWRIASKMKFCKQCGSNLLVEVDSELGKKLLAQYVSDGIRLEANASPPEIIKNKPMTFEIESEPNLEVDQQKQTKWREIKAPNFNDKNEW